MRINTNIAIFIFMLVGLAALRWYAIEDHKLQAQHPMTSEIAIEPDMMMRNAHHYLKSYQNSTAVKYIGKAIRSMKLIERDADSVSDQLIEKAIADLQSVESELSEEIVDIDHLNHAFMNALNSLAYAQLRMAEYYWVRGETNNSMFAMGYAINHLHNALQFSEPEKMEKEIKIYESIDMLLENQSLSEQEFISELDELIREMDKVIEY